MWLKPFWSKSNANRCLFRDVEVWGLSMPTWPCFKWRAEYPASTWVPELQASPNRNKQHRGHECWNLWQKQGRTRCGPYRVASDCHQCGRHRAPQAERSNLQPQRGGCNQLPQERRRSHLPTSSDRSWPKRRLPRKILSTYSRVGACSSCSHDAGHQRNRCQRREVDRRPQRVGLRLAKQESDC